MLLSCEKIPAPEFMLNCAEEFEFAAYSAEMYPASPGHD
jgi:hypothetical protein